MNISLSSCLTFTHTLHSFSLLREPFSVWGEKLFERLWFFKCQSAEVEGKKQKRKRTERIKVSFLCKSQVMKETVRMRRIKVLLLSTIWKTLHYNNRQQKSTVTKPVQMRFNSIDRAFWPWPQRSDDIPVFLPVISIDDWVPFDQSWKL